MKISCNREALSAAFQLAAGVAPSRTPKAILQNVKVTTLENSLLLEASDTEVSIRITVPDVEIKAAGTALLPVQRTGALLRESNDETLTIETDDQAVIIRGGRSRFRLPSGSADEFPQVPQFAEESYHEIPAGLFKELIRRTAFATDAESSRFALGGVLLEMENDSVLAVATDGRRLARMQGSGKSVGGHMTKGANTIVPVRSMTLIDRALTDKEGVVHVACRENDLVVGTSQWTIFTRLVEGRYPNWRQVIPKRTNPIRIELTVGPLFAGLRQAAVVADQESRGIDFRFHNGTLKMDATTANVGESHVELPIAYDGEELIVTLDNRYVGDFCKVLSPESSVVLEIEAADRPALLTTEDGYAYVIMPMARDR